MEVDFLTCIMFKIDFEIFGIQTIEKNFNCLNPLHK